MLDNKPPKVPLLPFVQWCRSGKDPRTYADIDAVCHEILRLLKQRLRQLGGNTELVEEQIGRALEKLFVGEGFRRIRSDDENGVRSFIRTVAKSIAYDGRDKNELARLDDEGKARLAAKMEIPDRENDLALNRLEDTLEEMARRRHHEHILILKLRLEDGLSWSLCADFFPGSPSEFELRRLFTKARNDAKACDANLNRESSPSDDETPSSSSNDREPEE